MKDELNTSHYDDMVEDSENLQFREDIEKGIKNYHHNRCSQILKAYQECVKEGKHLDHETMKEVIAFNKHSDSNVKGEYEELQTFFDNSLNYDGLKLYKKIINQVIKLRGSSIRFDKDYNFFYKLYKREELFLDDDENIHPNFRQALNQLPKKAELEKCFIDLVYEIYTEIPRSGNYIERVVRNMTDEWEQDSVRVAIVKQFYKYTDYEKGPVERYLRSFLSKEELKAYKKMDQEEKDCFMLERINDSLIDESYDVKALKLFTNKIKKKSLQLDDETRETVEAFTKKLYDNDLELIDDLNHYVGQDLSEVIQAIYNDLNKKLKDFDKDFSNRKFKLFEMADDLVNGRFKSNNKSKFNMYYFALAFGLHYYTKDESDVKNKKDDLVKNLFYDYYNEDVLNYVLGEKNDGSVEKMPLGIGPSFKNYRELLFLYFSRSSLTPREKIKKVDYYRDIINKYRGDRKTQEQEMEKKTVVFREKFENTLLNEDEETFVDTLKKNYVTHSNQGDGNIGYNQVTANQIFKCLVKAIYYDFLLKGFVKPLNESDKAFELAQMYKKDDDFDEDEDFTNPNLPADQRLPIALWKEEGIIPSDVDEKFIELLEILNKWITLKNRRSAKKEKNSHNLLALLNKGLSDEEQRITRIDMIIVYYYLFIDLFDNDSSDDTSGDALDFESLFGYFKNGWAIQSKVFTVLEKDEIYDKLNGKKREPINKENYEKKNAFKKAADEANRYLFGGLDTILDLCGFAPFDHKYFFDDFLELMLWHYTSNVPV